MLASESGATKVQTAECSMELNRIWGNRGPKEFSLCLNSKGLREKRKDGKHIGPALMHSESAKKIEFTRIIVYKKCCIRND